MDPHNPVGRDVVRSLDKTQQAASLQRNQRPETRVAHRAPPETSYRSLSGPYADAGSTWLEVGPGTAFPCSSIFIPRLKPIDDRISLISFSDLRPKFLVFSISASVFCTSSPMV